MTNLMSGLYMLNIQIPHCFCWLVSLAISVAEDNLLLGKGYVSIFSENLVVILK